MKVENDRRAINDSDDWLSELNVKYQTSNSKYQSSSILRKSAPDSYRNAGDLYLRSQT